MLSRTLASQSLRRSLLASSSILIPARQLPRHARLNSSTTDQPVSDEKKPTTDRRRAAASGTWVPPIVTHDQVKRMTEQPSPDSYLIDVREPDEVIQGSIPSSVNIPLSVLSHSLYVKAEDFKREFGFEKPKRNQEIVFYCRSGARSTTAGDIAKKIGYQRLYNYRGSWLEWVEKEGRKAGSS